MSFDIERSRANALLDGHREKAVDRRGGAVAGECPGMGARRFGNLAVDLPFSDPLSLILSYHDREHPAPVLDLLCMDELYCIMFF